MAALKRAKPALYQGKLPECSAALPAARPRCRAALPAALPPCRAAPGTFLLYMHSAVIPHYHPRAAMAPLTEARRGRGKHGGELDHY